MNSFNSHFKQFIKFGIVGFFNTIISFAITYGVIFFVSCVLEICSLNNLTLIFVANFFGFSAGVVNSYYWNIRYVFKTNASGLNIFIKSYICYGIIFIFSYILNLLFFVRILNLNNIIIPILQIVICTPLNFILNKFWAFK